MARSLHESLYFFLWIRLLLLYIALYLLVYLLFDNRIDHPFSGSWVIEFGHLPIAVYPARRALAGPGSLVMVHECRNG